MHGRLLTFEVLLGSLREASHSNAIAHTLDELAPDNVQVLVLDSLRGLPNFDEDLSDFSAPAEIKALGGRIAEADGLVIVTPEHNGSIPGALKNALDWLSRLSPNPLNGKPTAVVLSSESSADEAPGVLAVRQVLTTIGAMVLENADVVVSEATRKVDAYTGLLRDQDSRALCANQLKALTELVFTSRQKSGRKL